MTEDEDEETVTQRAQTAQSKPTRAAGETLEEELTRLLVEQAAAEMIYFGPEGNNQKKNDKWIVEKDADGSSHEHTTQPACARD